jgi:hypothetical protein
MEEEEEDSFPYGALELAAASTPLPLPYHFFARLGSGLFFF